VRRSPRLVLLLLLAAVVPIRGAIGASMVVCGPWHGGGTLAQQSEIAPSHAVRHAHHAHAHAPGGPPEGVGAKVHAPGGPPEEVGAPAHHHAADGASAHDHVSLGGSAHSAASACGLCAECCAGGSPLLSNTLTLPVVELTDAPFPPVEVRFERRAPDGLERPPHTRLV
jgi:hypothetical protein